MKKMKVLFFVLLISSTSIILAQKEKITLVITYKEMYCGGARPTPEMVAESEKSKPYANKMMVIVSDKYKVDSAKTNNKGQLIFKVKKGNYHVYEAWKFYKSGPNDMPVAKFEKECLKLEWERALFQINKTSKKTSIESSSEILIQCPWALPCMRPESIPPVPE